MKIPFSPPRIDQKVLDEVADTIQSGWWTTGPKTRKFEVMLADYLAAEAVLCLSSATAGLSMILDWFGVGEGDEIIIPAYTYCATANVVVHSGAKIVMVDCGEDFNINVNRVQEAITERTKIIIPVDIGGLPCDYNKLDDLVKTNVVNSLFSPENAIQKQLGRILILADAAHSLGASLNNVKCGMLADATVFSFHAVKNLSTAEGGAIAFNLPEGFNNSEIYTKLRTKSLHGQSKDALEKSQQGGWKYDVIEPGFKCNMTDILASIGIVELNRYQQHLDARMHICDIYNKELSKVTWAEVPELKTERKTSSYHIYLLRIKDISEDQRDQIIADMSAQGIAVNVHFIPLPLLTYYSNQGFNINEFPVALASYEREISLPVYYSLSIENAKLIISTFIDIVNDVRG